jgi:hypothetical protein
MSFNRLNYDMCQYKQSIYESVGPGSYMLATPSTSCDYCYPKPPTVRLQKGGDSINRNKPLVDTDGELNNRHRHASKCPENRLFSDMKIPKTAAKIRPSLRELKEPNYAKFEESFTNFEDNGQGLTHWDDCFNHTIESRHVDPASNLRGTGFDRWEYLCFNPQDKATIPFDYNVSNRLLVKDNHRPCIPKPIDPKSGSPPASGNPLCEKTIPVCSVPTTPNSLPCKKHPYYSS